MKFVGGLVLVLLTAFIVPAQQPSSPWLTDAERARFEELRRSGLDALYNIDYDKAQRDFKEIVQLFPNHPGGYQLLAARVWIKTLYESRRLQVSLATTGALPANVLLEDAGLTIEPAWVTVRGPASIIERVQHVTTESLQLARVRETTTRELELECDPRAFACEPDRVTVTLRVSARAERVLANIPPTVLLDSDDVDAEVEPDAVSLTLEGPASVIDTLSSGDVSVLVAVSGRGPASVRVAPDVILPPGIRLTAISADTLEVRVYPAR